MNRWKISTTIGPLFVHLNQAGEISRLAFSDEKPDSTHSRETTLDSSMPEVVREAMRQLDDLFLGRIDEVRFPMATGMGTEFERLVWAATVRIPRGQTRTYGQIAAAIGKPRSSRAVGAALGRNPLPFVVPCHRVVGQNGSLTGYAGGVEMKRRLLELEGALKSLIPTATLVGGVKNKEGPDR